MPKIHLYPGNTGFSLIEMAFVLVIISLLLGATLTLLTVRAEQTRIEATKQRMEIIKTALISFIEKRQRLPCPALAGQAPNNVNYGREAQNPGACTGSQMLAGNGVGSARGIVPWVTLGLPAEVALDGYSRQITYAVTLPATSLNQASVASMRGSLSLHSGTPPVLALPNAGNQTNTCNNSVVNGNNACNQMAVVMLVSHGKNGFGAYVPDSPQLLPSPAGISAAEGKNSNDIVINPLNEGEKFVQMTYSDSDVLANHFDDFLLPIMPSDLLSPLERNGVQPSAAALTRIRAEEFLDTVIVTALTAPTLPITLPTIPTDGWGNAMQVGPVATVSFCTQIPPAIITITSRGVDGISGTNSDTAVNDDLVFSRSTAAAFAKVCP